MSTIFAIIKENREGEKKIRVDIAHRRSIGGGKVGIKWFKMSLHELFNITKYFKNYNIDKIPVHAMDNTAQGVKNIGDLITLDKYGSLTNKYEMIDENSWNVFEFNNKTTESEKNNDK